jgi:hypothetical protein
MIGEKLLLIRRSFRFQFDMKVTKVSFSLLLFRTNISVNVLAIIRFVDEPCNLMFWFKLQLFLNVDPKIRLIGFGAQLSSTTEYLRA